MVCQKCSNHTKNSITTPQAWIQNFNEIVLDSEPKWRDFILVSLLCLIGNIYPAKTPLGICLPTKMIKYLACLNDRSMCLL